MVFPCLNDRLGFLLIVGGCAPFLAAMVTSMLYCPDHRHQGTAWLR